MVFKVKRQYQWWDNYKRSVPAEVVGAVIEGIEARDGVVTKEAFLEESRPDDSPTHELFEWDQDTAAEAYRLIQSRTIINSLRIVYEDESGEEKKVSAFIRTSGREEKSVYENIESALADDKKKANILNRIRGELDAFVVRNSHVEELADMLESASKKVRKGRKNGNNV